MDFKNSETAKNLMRAFAGESQARNRYTFAAGIARKEGLFADYLEKNQLFVSEVETGWMCLNCGHIHRGTMAPGHCPVCRHEQGYFVRMELAPYIQ